MFSNWKYFDVHMVLAPDEDKIKMKMSDSSL